MDIKLPELGEGVTEGELVKWLVKVGDDVQPDQPIVEIMTDKATVEVPSPQKGKVTALKAKEGDTIKIGETLIQLEPRAGATAATSTAKATGTNTEAKSPHPPPAPAS